MEFLLRKNLLGTEKSDLLVKGPNDFEKISVGPNSNVLKNRITIPSFDYWEICKLYNLPQRTFPPRSFRKAYESTFLSQGQILRELPTNFPWQAVIPETLYRKSLNQLVDNLFRDFEKVNLDYYFTHYKKYDIVFETLQPSAIDRAKYEQFIADGNDNTSKAVLKSFVPTTQREGSHFASSVSYDRLSSVTGRLTVKNGPGILHLRKDYRQILTSKWGKDGAVYYIDFKSLEPRILLALKNDKLKTPQDLYLYVAREMGLDENIDRNLVKTVIISMIYGAGDEELVKKLKGKIDYPEDFVNSIKEHFGVDDLRLQLKMEYESNKGKFICNFYNRPIFTESTAPYVLVNYFIQSTAVDIALSGFANIVERLVKSNGLSLIRPLFILHDALIMDVHNSVSHLLPKIASAGSSNIPGFEETKFWLDIEKLN